MKVGVHLGQYCGKAARNEMALGREVMRPICVTFEINRGCGAAPPFTRQAARDSVAIPVWLTAEAP